LTVTWYQHAVAYAEMKWPHLAPHSRASLADALATITPLLTRQADRRPAAGTLRADFIRGGLLLDCKSTPMPGKLGRDEIYQLAGYLLLDYPDEFGISRVGLYLSRQGATITWDAGEFLRLLGCVSPLPELREQLRRYLTACRARSRSTDAYRTAAAHLGLCPGSIKPGHT
jgi:hypothetical protein